MVRPDGREPGELILDFLIGALIAVVTARFYFG